MSYGFGHMIDILKKDPKKIVFTEGADPRILEAASRLLASYFLHPILIGKESEIYDSAEEAGYNIRGAEIIDPDKYDRFDEMVELFCEIRKSKGMTPEKAEPILRSPNYFGTMLVKMGVADALLGGATYSTADTVRPALQIIKTKPGNRIVSSCFILVRPAASGANEVLAMGDCAINIAPSEDDLVEIGIETALDIKNKLENGEIVLMAGDRLSAQNDNKCYETKLLGRKVSLPLGTLKFALMMEAPIYLLACLKNDDGTFKIESEKFKRDNSRSDNLNNLQKQFADFLERITLSKPYQIYNFYDFFEEYEII